MTQSELWSAAEAMQGDIAKEIRAMLGETAYDQQMFTEAEKQRRIEAMKVCATQSDDPIARHEAWCEQTREKGYVFGEKFDSEAKTHPNLVEWDKLPEAVKRKASIFSIVAKAFAGLAQKLGCIVFVFALSLVSGAIADDPVLDFGVFDPMPSVVAASDSAPLDFDVFGAGKTVVVKQVEQVPDEMFRVFEPMPVPVKPVSLVPTPTKTGGYPLRTTRWTGLPKDRAAAVQHLSTGAHAGIFDLTWLATLTWDELDCLHADHHEGCIDETAVRRAKILPAKPLPVASVQPTQCTVFWNGRQWVRVCR